MLNCSIAYKVKLCRKQDILLSNFRTVIYNLYNFFYFRQALEPGLANGASYSDLMYSFRVAKNTTCVFIPQVLEAIIQEYAEEVLPPVITPEQWNQIADDFQTKWNFPHACGAIDGKHVRIKNPKDSGSLFYNYKVFSHDITRSRRFKLHVRVDQCRS